MKMRNSERTFFSAFARNWLAIVGLLVLVGIMLLIAIGPYVYPQSPYALVGEPFLRPFGKYLLGTDAIGRDVAAGVVYGARTSLLIAVVATACAILIGMVMGGVAGYFAGWTDTLLMRLTEFFQTIPSFIFAALLVAIFRPSIQTTVIAISIVSWPPMARLIRGEFLAMRKREFVQACVGLGMSHVRVIVRHVLPNCLSSIVVAGSLLVGTAMLMEAGLSFLGLSDPNVMSWGYMIGAGRDFLQRAWWLCAIPGVAILCSVLAINLVGDGLNDALNPRQ